MFWRQLHDGGIGFSKDQRIENEMTINTRNLAPQLSAQVENPLFSKKNLKDVVVGGEYKVEHKKRTML